MILLKWLSAARLPYKSQPPRHESWQRNRSSNSGACKSSISRTADSWHSMAYPSAARTFKYPSVRSVILTFQIPVGHDRLLLAPVKEYATSASSISGLPLDAPSKTARDDQFTALGRLLANLRHRENDHRILGDRDLAPLPVDPVPYLQLLRGAGHGVAAEALVETGRRQRDQRQVGGPLLE